ncbi:MAG: anti-sigma factor [Acidocella sp.]|nr:anti-sigma factor [Acidocella sp.]
MARSDGPVTEAELHAYVDEQLALERRQIVEAWLARHPAEAERVSGWRMDRERLREAWALEEEDAIPLALTLSFLPHARRPFAFARMAAFLILALLTGGAIGWQAHRLPAGVAAVAQESMLADRTFTQATVPAGMTADPAHIATWVSKALNYPVFPPDLSKAGYSLKGAYLVATAHGPACVFLYDSSRAPRLSVFVRPMHGVDMEAPMRPLPTDTMARSGYVWADHGLGVAVIGARDAVSLRALTDDVRLTLNRRL